MCFLLFQAHLLSLFDNVNKVGFHEKNYDQILYFESQEGERVNLIEPVNAQVRPSQNREVSSEKSYSIVSAE